MSKPRASIFEESPQLDVGSFAPKTAIDKKAPPAEQVRAVAQAAQFRSREAIAAIHASAFDWTAVGREFELAKTYDEEGGNHPLSALYAGYLLAIGKKDEAVKIVRERAFAKTFDPSAYGIYELFLYAARADQTGSPDPPPLSKWSGPLERLHQSLFDIKNAHVVRYGRYHCNRVNLLHGSHDTRWH